jgi:hypothetical protein
VDFFHADTAFLRCLHVLFLHRAASTRPGHQRLGSTADRLGGLIREYVQAA